jgi:hypothetical protein
MNEDKNQMLSSLIDALESFWLENLAMHHLLEQNAAPNWFDLMYEYCQLDSSKALARERFAPFRTLIQSAQSDSKALESFLRDLQSKGKPN